MKIHNTLSFFTRICFNSFTLYSVIAIFVIQILVNFKYNNWIHHTSNKHQHESLEERIETEFKLLENGFVKQMDFPMAKVRYDNKRLYQIYEHVRTGEDWLWLRERYDVCLATQSSIDRLYMIPQILDKWHTPLSLAVFIISRTEWIVFNIYSAFLKKCYPMFGKSVSIHFIIPKNVQISTFSTMWKNNSRSEFLSDFKSKPCIDYNNNKLYLEYLLSSFGLPSVAQKDEIFKKAVYPQNHLRNVARKTCPTAWTYSVDIDIVPREAMAEMLQEFYKKFILKEFSNCLQRCAFVVPTFGVLPSEPYPMSKKEIISYYNIGKAKQVNMDFKNAHYATDYKRWISTNIDELETKVSHDIMNKTEFYEPYYISDDSIPSFDERFLGYGVTRSSQFREAILAGWTFSVLTPVFSIHWGFHNTSWQHKSSVGDQMRRKQNAANLRLFKKVVKEMKLKQSEGIF